MTTLPAKMLYLRSLRVLVPVILAVTMLAGCSELLSTPTATPVPTPIPRFGMPELQDVFKDIPEGYVEVPPHSRELGSASFNDAFALQMAFHNSATRLPHSFSVSLGILHPDDLAAFDYSLEKTWGTADSDLIQTENVNRALGIFWLDIGDKALGSRLLEVPVRSQSELRESVAFRRGEVAVIVKFAQPVEPVPIFGRNMVNPDRDEYVRSLVQDQFGDAYIRNDPEPGFITGPKAAMMVDEAIVRFYGGLTDSGAE